MNFYPTIALTARWDTYPDRFNWIRDNNFALEYSINPGEPEQLTRHINPFLENRIPVRYHAFFPGYEIGHQDDAISERAMHIHQSALEAMHGYGEQVITVHIGLNPDDEIIPEKAVSNLTRLVKHASNLKITVCLENLRRGYTSNPEYLSDWAQKSGAMITFDAGHALSNQRVMDGELTIDKYLDMIVDRIHEAHIYEKETDRHYPPGDMSVLGPVINRLLDSQCRWWTIELDDYNEALITRELLQLYLE